MTAYTCINSLTSRVFCNFFSNNWIFSFLNFWRGLQAWCHACSKWFPIAYFQYLRWLQAYKMYQLMISLMRLFDSFSQSQPNLSDRHNRDKRSRSLATSDASNQSIQAELLRSYLEQVIFIKACLYLHVPSVSIESLILVWYWYMCTGEIFISVVCIPSRGLAREKKIQQIRQKPCMVLSQIMWDSSKSIASSNLVFMYF